MIIGVLGANGFVGRSLCTTFLNSGNTVLAFYNSSQSDVPEGCVCYAVDRLPETKMNCLFIAMGGHGLSYESYLRQFLSLQATLQALNFDRMVYISSTEVYGAHIGIINADSCYNNPKTYGLSKLMEEFLINSFENVSIIRPTYIYGIGMKPNSLVPIWIKQALVAKEIVVYGDGTRCQDYLHINDLMDLCQLLATSVIKEVVVAATGNSITNMDLAKCIGGHLGGIKISTRDSDLSSSFHFDVSKTFCLFGWQSKISIQDGIKELIDYEIANL
ncbi:NAD(P)-dependent oxidoreductase [Pedobacter sp. MC2016-14]|uniref:NAD-dependent epimerase/dehydratase family protein n=1 Tax=Pedobacter sp. MC2016-14 TaxID=2897327 RepID=UPI001E4E1309|nr:NAD(P)-dependent oxidoreductase [Pedobacter sp. MC2016-14]MCD0486902.1 NAD(P)-dependent oxidoreductase [Pedobacter sp. MC2016-14]